MKVVFVCTGNLCRSPMAEGLLRHAAEQRGCDLEVSSVGTWAYFGNRAMPESVASMRSLGIDISGHRSRPVEHEELAAADLIVAMTSVHLRELRQIAPQHMSKVVLLKEMAEIEMERSDGGGDQRLAALLAGKRPKSRRSLDVDDPIGQPMSVYERCVRELQAGVDFLIDLLC